MIFGIWNLLKLFLRKWVIWTGRFSHLSVLLSIAVFGLSDFDDRFSVFQRVFERFFNSSLTVNCMFAFCSVPVLLFLSRETCNGTASGADRNKISNHVITFQISNFYTFCFPQIPIISLPLSLKFLSQSDRRQSLCSHRIIFMTDTDLKRVRLRRNDPCPRSHAKPLSRASAIKQPRGMENPAAFR